jgi:hypothetical protein
MNWFLPIGVGAVLAVGVANAQGAAAHIPALHGAVLTGQTVDLPEALKGKVGVLVVGFSQSSRDEVTAWGKRLNGDYRDSGAVLYYEMPVLASVPKLLRGWVLSKIKGSVPPVAQGRFLPVLDHEGDWKAAAGFGRADVAYILVVDGNGKVCWKTEGPASDVSYTEVKKQVDQARSK